MDQKTEKDKTERITGRGRRTREDRAKRNKMTALRLKTGGRHQTSPASLRGDLEGAGRLLGRIGEREEETRKEQGRILGRSGDLRPGGSGVMILGSSRGERLGRREETRRGKSGERRLGRSGERRQGRSGETRLGIVVGR